MLRFKEKINYKDPSCFDFITGKHGKYEGVRSFKRMLAYCKKTDQNLICWGDIELDKDWSDILNSNCESEVWRQLYELRPRDAAMSGDRVVNNWRKRKRALEPPKPPPSTIGQDAEAPQSAIQLFWFYGEGGTGKDRRVQQICHDNKKTLYIKNTTSGHWWDNYNGEDCVCFEDMRGSDMSMHEFFQFTSPWRKTDYTVPVKGGFTLLKAHTFFVTTGCHPIDMWKPARKEWSMLKRRLTKIFYTTHWPGDNQYMDDGIHDVTLEEPPQPVVSYIS